jgi:hypothetical protein
MINYNRNSTLLLENIISIRIIGTTYDLYFYECTYLPKSEVNFGAPQYRKYCNLGFIVYSVYTFQFPSRIIILFEPYIGVLNLHRAFDFKQCIIHYVDLFYNLK